MSVPRDNAPLVELIAELRWEPSPEPDAQIGTVSGPTFIAAHSGRAEGFFMRFAGRAHALAHSEHERLVPPGFPMLPQQPVHRFKHIEGDYIRTLYQVGPGMFSTNAVPPYESWEQRFRPVLMNGVDALLACMPPEDREKPFTGLSLRYIDAFTEHHTQGKDIATFMRDVLNISISVPDAISMHLRSGALIKPMIQIQVPMENGFLMGISVGEGTINGSQAIMMDTTVSSTFPLAASIVSAMTSFDIAHEAISTTFKNLIRPIENLIPERAGVLS